MADEEQQPRILKEEGVEAWNAWREQAGDIGVDLSEANLRGAHLREANLRGVNLSFADLSSANLRGAKLREADLSFADLSKADLRDADLRMADLTRANLSGTDLSSVNLSGADLSEANLNEAELGSANLREALLNRTDLTNASLISANLHGANLSGANLSEANLSEANLSEAQLYETNLNEAWAFKTIFSDLDLGSCGGLENCRHGGPSHIDIRTLQRSGRLPLAFLRGVGLPETLIDYLPSLLNQPIQHYSCFISYSSKDDEFVHRLHADLQDKGVRCWFAPHDLKIGAKILDTLDEAIRLRDKVLLVLSEASITSEWVEDEVTKAFEEERQRGGTVLFPVRVDDAVFATKEAWAAKLRRSRNIGDFRAWKDHDAYQKALERVLRDLRVESASFTS